MSAIVKRQVGILGGMGPAATVDFYNKLISETPARFDQEHLAVVVWADPSVPDRSENLVGDGEDPTPWLERGIQALVQAGCEILAVPCNTAHAFVPRLACEAGIQLVSIVEATADAIHAKGITVTGLLATTGTVQSRLYSDALERRDIATVAPVKDDQELVMAAIRAVKAGIAGPAHAQTLAEVSATLAGQGAQIVVAACTELVLALGGTDVGVPLLDPARILARSVVEVAFAPKLRVLPE